MAKLRDGKTVEVVNDSSVNREITLLKIKDGKTVEDVGAWFESGVDDPVPPLRWFLDELVDGQPLTQTGNLGRAFVQDAAGRFGWWDFDKPPRGEDELYDLHQVRHLAQRLGLARRSRRQLVLTPKGRAALADDRRLWRLAARRLLPEHEFAAALGEITLAVPATRASTPAERLRAEWWIPVDAMGEAASAAGQLDLAAEVYGAAIACGRLAR